LGIVRSDGDTNPQNRVTRSGVDADRATMPVHDDAPCDV